MYLDLVQHAAVSFLLLNRKNYKYHTLVFLVLVAYWKFIEHPMVKLFEKALQGITDYVVKNIHSVLRRHTTAFADFAAILRTVARIAHEWAGGNSFTNTFEKKELSRPRTLDRFKLFTNRIKTHLLEKILTATEPLEGGAIELAPVVTDATSMTNACIKLPRLGLEVLTRAMPAAYSLYYRSTNRVFNSPGKKCWKKNCRRTANTPDNAIVVDQCGHHFHELCLREAIKGECSICHDMKIAEFTELGEQWGRNLAAAVEQELEDERARASASEQAASAATSSSTATAAAPTVDLDGDVVMAEATGNGVADTAVTGGTAATSPNGLDTEATENAANVASEGAARVSREDEIEAKMENELNAIDPAAAGAAGADDAMDVVVPPAAEAGGAQPAAGPAPLAPGVPRPRFLANLNDLQQLVVMSPPPPQPIICGEPPHEVVHGVDQPVTSRTIIDAVVQAQLARVEFAAAHARHQAAAGHNYPANQVAEREQEERIRLGLLCDAEVHQQRVINVATRPDVAGADIAAFAAIVDQVVNQRLAPLREEIANLRTDTANLRTDTANLRTDMANLRTNVDNLRAGMDRLHNQVVALVMVGDFVNEQRLDAVLSNARAYRVFYARTEHLLAPEYVEEQTMLMAMIPPLHRLTSFHADHNVFRTRAPPLPADQEDEWVGWPNGGVEGGEPLFPNQPLLSIPIRALRSFPQRVSDIETLGMSNRDLLTLSAFYGVDFVPPGVDDLDVMNRDPIVLGAFVTYITAHGTFRHP
ncbi:hypothetical protein GGF32_002977 [Allomyces javanicus]|nr:hypothetical protein GGF32_002977 [Allomyces javanicus]